MVSSIKSDVVLESITQRDFKRIYKLTTNQDVMKYIGNGQIWNQKKVSKFIQYCLEEENLPDYQRDQYYYKIMDYSPKSKSKSKSNSRALGKKKLSQTKNKRGTFIGIIGFHKFIKGNEPYLTKSQKQRHKEFYLTIFLNPDFQGKGYFPISIKLLIQKMKKHQPKKNSLYLMVREDNYRMNLYSNKYYQFLGKIKIKPNVVLNEYCIKYQ